MQKGILCLSFDDGRKDHRQVAEYLLQKNIPATFNITTGYVDRTCPEELVPSKKEALSIEDVCWINEQPIFEVALHGNNHLNTFRDIQESRSKLTEWLNLSEEDKIGFASPGSGLNVSLIDKEKGYFDDKISYVRLSLRIKHHKVLRIMARKLSRIFHLPFLYGLAYADTLMKKSEVEKIIYSVPVMGDITFEEVKALVDMCAKQRKVLILMFHSIGDKVTKNEAWTWEKKKFGELCDYILKNKQLNIYSLKDVYDMLNS